MYEIRDYQQEALNAIYTWWMDHQMGEFPILELPTGAGKSIVIAELVRLLFETWPEDHPRTIVIVPSKELAEQNAEKLRNILPTHLSVGYYCASLGQKMPAADVIVATIGSIANAAHIVGNIKCVIIDEAHRVNPDGAGQYRKFLTELSDYCKAYNVVGLTATPFRGNGIWLTDGKDPLFSGIAYRVPVQRLLDAGHLAPLVRPIDVIQTRIDASDITIQNGDYNIHELSENVSGYIEAGAKEAVKLAEGRKKWIAFTPTVENAISLVGAMRSNEITAELVCGSTPKKEREQKIADFRAGEIQCLVTVLALAVGFDVPDVDCVIWFRPTRSPVLYVQGAGRGLRPAPGKTDCLWIDFSDTTERLGPVDTIKGRRRTGSGNPNGPFAICPECGAQVKPASSLECPECGAVLREQEEKKHSGASAAPVMQSQVAALQKYEVTNVTYRVHKKPDTPPSMRVDYWTHNYRLIASDWVCPENQNPWARERANKWLLTWTGMNVIYLSTAEKAVEACREFADMPSHALVNESGKYPVIVELYKQAVEV